MLTSWRPQSCISVYGWSALDVVFDRSWCSKNMSSPHFTRPRQALSLQVESEVEDGTWKCLSPLSIYPVNLSFPYPCQWSDYHHIRRVFLAWVWWSHTTSWKKHLKSLDVSLKGVFTVIGLSLAHTHLGFAWVLILLISHTEISHPRWRLAFTVAHAYMFQGIWPCMKLWIQN